LQNMLDNKVFCKNICEGCTKEKFYSQHLLNGSAVCLAVEQACFDPLRLDELDEVLHLIPADDTETCLATYEFFGENVIHIMHIAASLGSPEVMERIRDHCGSEVMNWKSMVRRPAQRGNTTPGTSRFGDLSSSHGRDRLCRRGTDLSLKLPPMTISVFEPFLPVSTQSNGMLTIQHYTPLHSAVYFSQVKAAIWLLDNGASPNEGNMDGMTALHILAQGGLPHEFDRQLRDVGLQEVTFKMMEASADLTAKAGDFEDRLHDTSVDFLRCRTPLEIAASKRSSYPKHLLHLLAQSFQTPDTSRPLSEVAFIAATNPAAAEHLMEKVKGNRAARRRLLLEVNAKLPYTPQLMEHQDAIETFLDVLKVSPVAAADVLEVLTVKPQVQELAKHPLPRHAVLENRTMICTFRPDVYDKQPEVIDQTEWIRPVWSYPAADWHAAFKTDLPLDPLAQERVYSVETCVVHMPEILDMRVPHILGKLWTNSRYTEIFSRLPIQAIIECLWTCRRLYRLHRMSMLIELTLLFVLIFVGAFHVDVLAESWPYAHNLIKSFVLARMLVELWRLPFGARMMSRHAGETHWHFIKHFAFASLALTLPLLPLLTLWGIEDMMDVWKVLVAVNIFLRCFKLLFVLLRSETGIGTTIIAVLNSGVAPQLQHMAVILVVVVMGFWAIFVALKDDDKSAQYVFLYLYLAMFFGEGDGIENISGFDTNGENYKGHGSIWLKQASIVFMLIGSFYSMVCLLNLIIAMYSNYYEEQQPVARLLFHQVRAKDSIRYLIRPSLPAGIVRRLGWKCCRRLMCTLAAFLFLSWLGLMYALEAPCSLAVLPALVMSLIEAALLLSQWSDGAEGADKPHYLWICYRSDFDEVHWRGGDQKRIASLQKNIDDLSQQVSVLTELLQGGPPASPMCASGSRPARMARAFSMSPV